jgi:hypothetical protein
MSHESQEEQQPLKGKKSSKESSQKSGKQEQRIVIRATRDEMNLAEYPFAALSHNGPEKVIENHWDHSHPDTGRIVHATWRVAGDPKLGLPRPADECVYLVRMELTRAADMAQKVQFSRGDLLRRLGWPDNEQHYNRLKDAFTRLEMVGIVAENCFWDNRVRNYKTVGFSLIDNFEIVPESKGRKKAGTAGLSYFKWNDVIHESMMANYVKCLNLDFALSLERPLARRIYRYLDKNVTATTCLRQRKPSRSASNCFARCIWACPAARMPPNTNNASNRLTTSCGSVAFSPQSTTTE